MSVFPRVVALQVLLPVVGFLAFGGCGKKETLSQQSPGKPDPLAVAAKVVASVAAPKSAEPNSFDEVAAQLDRGGPLYLYVSTEQWLGGLSQKLLSLRDLIKIDPSVDNEETKKIIDQVADLIKKTGIEQISGVGASSFALEPGLYRNKVFLHHYKGKGDGLFWSAMGGAPHRLEALDLLPPDTALAGFIDLDLTSSVALVRQMVEQSGMPEAQQGLNQALLQFSVMTGMTIDELLASLGGSVGVILTLDPSKPITIPPLEKPKLPLPRLALVIQVKNDRIFQQIDKALTGNPTVVRVDEADLHMRTMAAPISPEFSARPTAAQWGQRLIIASDDQLVRDLITAQKDGKGFKATPEFTKLADGMPTEGNGFQLVTTRFIVALTTLQLEMMAEQNQAALMEKLMSWQKSGPAYSVSAHREDGWLGVGKGTSGAGQLVAPMIVVPAAFAAGVAMPVFGKVQERSVATKSLSNGKQIATACKLYALDNNGKFPPSLDKLIPDYLPDASLLPSPFNPSEPMGYDYTPGLTDTAPPDTILLKDRFAVQKKFMVNIYVDTSGKVTPLPSVLVP